MRLKALSHYDKDLKTRYGDCILLYDFTSLIVYDCGHERHAQEIQTLLQQNPTIKQVRIIISHNDSDHTNGIIPLITRLSSLRSDVCVYLPLYLKHAKEIHDLLDDRHTYPKTKEHILEIFNNIADIVEASGKFGFKVIDSLKGTQVLSCKIVGPDPDVAIAVVAQAIKDGTVNMDGETVMNAASVQLSCTLENSKKVLLCGDATPEYLPDLSGYGVVQLPHHGKLDNAEAIFNTITTTKQSIGLYTFLISDNTGDAPNSGGSDNLMNSELRKGKDIWNTKQGKPVELGDTPTYSSSSAASKGYGVLCNGTLAKN